MALDLSPFHPFRRLLRTCWHFNEVEMDEKYRETEREWTKKKFVYKYGFVLLYVIYEKNGQSFCENVLYKQVRFCEISLLPSRFRPPKIRVLDGRTDGWSNRGTDE